MPYNSLSCTVNHKFSLLVLKSKNNIIFSIFKITHDKKDEIRWDYNRIDVKSVKNINISKILL